MVTLQNFSSFSQPGEVSLCEKDARLCSVPMNELDSSQCFDTSLIHEYPEIFFNREMFHSSSTLHDDHRNLMIPVSETYMKKIIRTIFEEGIVAAIQETKNAGDKSGNSIVSALANYVLHVVNIGQRVKLFVKPHLKEQGVTSIAKFSQTRDWMRSPIRCMRWHPNCFKIAVAACDDSIRIYTDEISIVPIIKNGLQKCVTSLAWRPFSASELAVGCQIGALIWTVDPNSNITRPLSQATQLKYENHFPVTSLDWSPDGTLLATASISDTDILIWDVDNNRNTPLKRVGSPYSLIKWSPVSSQIFSATVGLVFRVWNTDNWTPERWTISHGFIQSMVWSPCGGHILFVTSEEPFLYGLKLVEEQLFNSPNSLKHALPIADLSKINVRDTDVGGQPQSLAWDPKGRYLAIIFKDSPVIAVFTTTIVRHLFNISPSCFLTGNGAEHPSYICFQESYKNKLDTVLTIGWSSGRVQYFPFL